MTHRAAQEFRSRFGVAATCIARAPGRVNLIGDHTDYNDGFVLPIALDRAVHIALRPRTDRIVSLYSLDFEEQGQFDIDDPNFSTKGWLQYVHAVASVLRQDYSLNGFDGVVAGDVPIGAGLSSSAALELAAAQAFRVSSHLTWNAREMALLAQRAENVWVGVNCGIMDQMISAVGEQDHALLIDCRSLALRPIRIPATVAVIVLDTATRRGLVDSAYNERRMNCEAAAAFLGVDALRDVDNATFERASGGMAEIMRKRARHVITENERTLHAAQALEQGDVVRFGQLMDASHASLRDDFEVSNRELDGMAAIARAQPRCFGARMTGAGFGGCAVAVVAAEAAPDFMASVARQYRATFGLEPALYACAPAAGASIEPVAANAALS